MTTEEPTEVSSEPTAQPTTEPTPDPTTEPTIEPTADPTTEPAAEATPVPFTAEVEIELVNKGAIYFGDEVTLRAVVKNATAAYAIRWEVNDGNGWKEIQGENGDEYEFVVTEENAGYSYRVALTALA